MRQTTTKTVKKKVTVRVKGRKKTVTRKVKETVPTTLEMPNEFVAQNGAVINRTTPISVTGCPKDGASRRGEEEEKGWVAKSGRKNEAGHANSLDVVALVVHGK